MASNPNSIDERKKNCQFDVMLLKAIDSHLCVYFVFQMRIRVDTEGKEIRSLHSFPPLLSPSLERISLGPFSSLCIRRFVVDKQLQPLFTNATLLPYVKL